MTVETQLIVRTYECDEYGHVNNAVYLNYLEAARGEFLDAAGFRYRDLVAAGYGILVARVAIDYKMPLFPGERFSIFTRPIRRRGMSGVLEQLVKRGDDLAARAEVTWASVNRTGRLAPLPAGFDVPGLAPED